eukprot:CAMPEP_0184412074 /NCGR_PEP_ID=MMETSP0738-20130409/6181_1 /TAXON_ID=385413 /ORGANISM="Thalassiosira miniscula, Strain CCMP1093" /LENGTH=212 /DNA_ID=CAMNT_0026770469 /DNA_START=610 /DNA_END=1247 /DNA_ORIENTATION=+
MTGISFQNNQLPIVMSAPIIMPSGNRYMLTTACSNTRPKKIRIGIHIAITLPPTVFEYMAPTTPIDTIQLHRMPLTNTVNQPAAPYSAKPRVRASAAPAKALPTALGSAEKAKVSEMAIIVAENKAPARLPTATRPQFLNIPDIVAPGRLSNRANGTNANTPVNKSKPQQVEDTKANREDKGTDNGVASLNCGGDGKGNSNCQNRTGHKGAN